MTVNSTAQTNYAALNAQSQSSVSSSNSFTTMMQQLADQLMNSVDTNKDGSIDKTEFSAAAQKLSQNPATANTDTSAANLSSVFNSIDTNGDGTISSSELVSALQNSTQQSSQTGGVHHHHHAHSQSGASGMASQSSTASAIQSTATAQSSTQSTNNIQSILMKNILSAYGVSQSQSSGTSAGNTTSSVSIAV